MFLAHATRMMDMCIYFSDIVEVTVVDVSGEDTVTI